ncbi:hypothetical protein CC78DRAFT_523987 [Lojkania enalia]|uniref:Heterokaryon incompatibility domain-containing protein n=1 Tax=Lojkania enalia TaxID=147567 RepID=A0A9P4K317_9PLEO|nr:hypothetical protein CC78DRAFT_523987 [Didymosphaeria enalia]
MESPSGQPYLYSPLPTRSSIRLVRRKENDIYGRICISLQTIDLAWPPVITPYRLQKPTGPERPWFHCLSYTWGNPHASGNGLEDHFHSHEKEYDVKNVTDIVCDGKILKIGKNLHEFFCQTPTNWIRRILDRPHPATGKTFLHREAASTDYPKVHAYAGSGLSVNFEDYNGCTPLHDAASEGRLENVKILLKSGAQVNIKDKKGRTPRNYASANGHIEVAEALRKSETEMGMQEVIEDVPPFISDTADDYIWIDAICINQDDIGEREAQVAIMNRIYSLAQYVIVWLGAKDQFTELGISTIRKIVGSAQNIVDSGIVPYRDNDFELFHRYNVPYISQEEWNALAAIFLRQWFRRMWVIQEAVFAKGIIMYCGNSDVGWNNLETVAAVMEKRGQALGHNPSTIYVPIHEVASGIEHHFRVISSLRQQVRELQESKDLDAEAVNKLLGLYSLIALSLPFRATDPRDKLYALLPLHDLNPNMRLEVRPDYRISVERCFSIFSKVLISEASDLKPLALVRGQSEKSLHNLPSWVLDFSVTGINPLLVDPFSASSNLAEGVPRCDISLDIAELGIKGVQVDTIIRTAAARSTGGLGCKVLEIDDSWFHLLEKIDDGASYRAMGQLPPEVLWRTLCADMDRLGQTPAPAGFSDQFKTLLCAMVCNEPELKISEEEAQNKRVIGLYDLLCQALGTQHEDKSGLVIVDSDKQSEAGIQDQISRPIRSVNSPYFERVRPLLSQLEAISAKYPGQCIPTMAEVDAYFKLGRPPLRLPNGAVNIFPDIQPYAGAHHVAYGGRRLFQTEKGFLGLGPASLKFGDEVWVVYGSKVPILLRSSDVHPEGRYYTMVGAAYVHGIMHGEAAKGFTDKDLVDVILV